MMDLTMVKIFLTCICNTVNPLKMYDNLALKKISVLESLLDVINYSDIYPEYPGKVAHTKRQTVAS